MNQNTKANPTPSVDTQILHNVKDAVEAALARKAEKLQVLDLEGLTAMTGFFLICSGANTRQVKAIVDSIREVLYPKKVRPIHMEGYNEATWVLMDYGDFVVHVFEKDRREFFSLERLWSEAPDRTPEFASAPSDSADSADSTGN